VSDPGESDGANTARPEPGRIPHLYLVAARELFATDELWLESLERVAEALSRLALDRDTARIPGAALEVALQVRIETELGALHLAAQALERVHQAAPAVRLFLNAAADAASLGYDGVHWPERRIPDRPGALPLPAAASVHSEAALHRAENAGASFVLYGPVWSPGWKKLAGRGIDSLGALAARAMVPVLAIGGITPERVPACLGAGAAGVAVASGVFRAADSRAALAAYAAVLRAASTA